MPCNQPGLVTNPGYYGQCVTGSGVDDGTDDTPVLPTPTPRSDDDTPAPPTPSPPTFSPTDAKHHQASEDDTSHIIYGITITGAVIASLFSLFVIFSYVRFASLQKRSLEMVTMLSFSELCTNAVYISYPNYKHKSNTMLCVGQGVLLQFFTFSVAMWAFMIGCALFSIVVLRDAFISRKQTQAIVWGVSLLATLPPLAVDGVRWKGSDYGDAGPW